MIGNPKWFRRRKYSGWGLTPNTWQGWLYILGMVGIVLAIQSIATWLQVSKQMQVVMVLTIISLILLDVIDIVRGLPNDEREIFHEAIAERNATWFIVTALCAGLIYQTYKATILGLSSVDPFILIALLGGTVVKAITNWYMLDK